MSLERRFMGWEPDLKWQETENYNVSLDFTMFRNILSAKVEYYENTLKIP